MNNPPYFVENVVSYLPVQKNDKEENWNYEFPSYKDPENDFVLFIVDTVEVPFVTQINKSLFIFNTTSESVIPCFYQLNYTLSDGVAQFHGEI